MSAPLLRAMLAGLAAVLAGACAEQPSGQDIAPEIEAWVEASGARVAPNVIRLRNGDCLDASRLLPPWQADRDGGGNSIAIRAEGHLAGIRPDDRPGFPGQDGVVRAQVSGWSKPDDRISRWFVAAPDRIDANIASGMFRPTSLWPGNALGLTSHSGPGGASAYVDARRYTQCRDYGDLGLIRCGVVSADGQYWFAVDLSAGERKSLPERLQTMLAAVEVMRSPCPS